MAEEDFELMRNEFGQFDFNRYKRRQDKLEYEKGVKEWQEKRPKWERDRDTRTYSQIRSRHPALWSFKDFMIFTMDQIQRAAHATIATYEQEAGLSPKKGKVIRGGDIFGPIMAKLTSPTFLDTFINNWESEESRQYRYNNLQSLEYFGRMMYAIDQTRGLIADSQAVQMTDDMVINALRSKANIRETFQAPSTTLGVEATKPANVAKGARFLINAMGQKLTQGETNEEKMLGLAGEAVAAPVAAGAYGLSMNKPILRKIPLPDWMKGSPFMDFVINARIGSRWAEAYWNPGYYDWINGPGKIWVNMPAAFLVDMLNPVFPIILAPFAVAKPGLGLVGRMAARIEAPTSRALSKIPGTGIMSARLRYVKMASEFDPKWAKSEAGKQKIWGLIEGGMEGGPLTKETVNNVADILSTNNPILLANYFQMVGLKPRTMLSDLRDMVPKGYRPAGSFISPSLVGVAQDLEERKWLHNRLAREKIAIDDEFGTMMSQLNRHELEQYGALVERPGMIAQVINGGLDLPGTWSKKAVEAVKYRMKTADKVFGDTYGDWRSNPRKRLNVKEAGEILLEHFKKEKRARPVAIVDEATAELHRTRRELKLKHLKSESEFFDKAIIKRNEANALRNKISAAKKKSKKKKDTKQITEMRGQIDTLLKEADEASAKAKEFKKMAEAITPMEGIPQGAVVRKATKPVLRKDRQGRIIEFFKNKDQEKLFDIETGEILDLPEDIHRAVMRRLRGTPPWLENYFVNLTKELKLYQADDIEKVRLKSVADTVDRWLDVKESAKPIPLRTDDPKMAHPLWSLGDKQLQEVYMQEMSRLTSVPKQATTKATVNFWIDEVRKLRTKHAETALDVYGDAGIRERLVRQDDEMLELLQEVLKMTDNPETAERANVFLRGYDVALRAMKQGWLFFSPSWFLQNLQDNNVKAIIEMGGVKNFAKWRTNTARYHWTADMPDGLRHAQDYTVTFKGLGSSEQAQMLSRGGSSVDLPVLGKVGSGFDIPIRTGEKLGGMMEGLGLRKAGRAVRNLSKNVVKSAEGTADSIEAHTRQHYGTWAYWTKIRELEEHQRRMGKPINQAFKEAADKIALKFAKDEITRVMFFTQDLSPMAVWIERFAPFSMTFAKDNLLYWATTALKNPAPAMSLVRLNEMTKEFSMDGRGMLYVYGNEYRMDPWSMWSFNKGIRMMERMSAPTFRTQARDEDGNFVRDQLGQRWSPERTVSMLTTGTQAFFSDFYFAKALKTLMTGGVNAVLGKPIEEFETRKEYTDALFKLDNMGVPFSDVTRMLYGMTLPEYAMSRMYGNNPKAGTFPASVMYNYNKGVREAIAEEWVRRRMNNLQRGITDLPDAPTREEVEQQFIERESSEAGWHAMGFDVKRDPDGELRNIHKIKDQALLAETDEEKADWMGALGDDWNGRPIMEHFVPSEHHKPEQREIRDILQKHATDDPDKRMELMQRMFDERQSDMLDYFRRDDSWIRKTFADYSDKYGTTFSVTDEDLGPVVDSGKYEDLPDEE